MAKPKKPKTTINKTTPKPKSAIEKKGVKMSASLKEKHKTDGSYFGDAVLSANPSSNGLIPNWNMKLVSWNVNGIRSCIKAKGLEYILKEDADVVAVQETKCSKTDIPEEAKNLKMYKSFWYSADKPGYAGTGLYSKISPISVKYGIGKPEHDDEGRVITIEYEKFFFVTAYVPNSGRGLVRLGYRQNSWDPDFGVYLKTLDEIKPVIVCGDLNVSHEEIDLANPKSNTKTAGFTIQERDGFGELLKSVGLVDSFRHIYPNRIGAYTYWSNMKDCRSRNIGWRLDYFLISKRLLPNLCNQELRTSVVGSDHCPVVLYLNF